MLMIFFFVMPATVSGFGNLLLPLLSGVPEMVFPKVNNVGQVDLTQGCSNDIFEPLCVKSDKPLRGSNYKARFHWERTQIGPKGSKVHKNPIMTPF